jgi:uncharacterized protein YjbJ (UPF0337 family)
MGDRTQRVEGKAKELKGRVKRETGAASRPRCRDRGRRRGRRTQRKSQERSRQSAQHRQEEHAIAVDASPSDEARRRPMPPALRSVPASDPVGS